MHRHENGDLAVYTFETLPQDRVGHAVFTRHGGASVGDFATLNVGATLGDDPAAIAENHRRIYAHLGLAAEQVTTARQVHGNRVQVVRSDGPDRAVPNTDGLTTAQSGAALLLRFADCQPVLLYDPEHEALALVHAGWRGVAQAVAVRAVEAMAEAFGTRPHALIAGLGPAIGPCCYTVGDDVAAAMGYALPDWRRVMTRDGELWRFDLPIANELQLASAGVQQIEQAGLCTACRTDEFYSHRAERGRTGRFAALAYLPGSGPVPEPAHATATADPLPPAAPDGTLSLQPPGLPSFEELRGMP